MMNNPYYTVKNSWAPLFSALSIFFTMGLLSATMWKSGEGGFFVVALIMFSFMFMIWFKEIYREADSVSTMADKEIPLLEFSFLLFIVSEILFFTSFFWAYFHFSFSPDGEMGNIWPPFSLAPIPFFETPLLNTVVLLASGISITWAHHLFFSKSNWNNGMYLILVTMLLGAYFTFLQAQEYFESPFSINDSSYGSVFFTATGFHGLHIIVGTFLLLSVLVKFVKGVVPSLFQTHFELAAWYWHFVDVVWLFLYICIYWWGY
uniref:Cytochrome c oxidase subunit 3 n=1 Tax=Gordionus wolterstorffii TaxID=190562 RepID=A0A514ABY8_9BILA|nr:cytochrome c oxidase subunit 3 [Gordionus wolterstorffii]